MNRAEVEPITRRELLQRAAGAALAARALPLIAPLAEPAFAAPTGIFGSLARSIRGDVVVPGDPRYTASRVLFDTRFDAVHPQAVVFCETTGDVERAVQWARRHAVHIVPRSGGHSYGGYSVTPGVVVDVSRLAQVALGAGHRATIGAGARLVDVDTGLWAHGRAIPAGTCPTVGIAGLTQGGGIGFAARKLGLTCDNLLEATVVLASGRAVVCNARENPDLYWALRGGGGGNFGIVTRFVFRSHAVGRVATFTLQWPWLQARRAVKAWQAWAPHAPDGLFSVCNLSCAGGGTPTITAAGQFFGSAAELERLLRPLTHAAPPGRLSVVNRSYIDAVQLWSGCSGALAECHLPPQGHLGRSTFKGASDYVNRPVPSRGIDALVRAVEARAREGTGRGIVLLDSSGGAINRVPKAATAFVHRDALFSFQYLAYWSPTDPRAVVARNLAWLRATRVAMRPFVSGYAYQNYIDPDLANWQHAYYGSNFARLVDVKRKYDPDNVFRFRQSIPTRV